MNKIIDDNKNIIEVLSFNHGSLQSAIAGIRQDLQEERSVAEKTQAATLAAILILKDGSSRIIAGPTKSFSLFAKSPKETSAQVTANSATTYTINNIGTQSTVVFNENMQHVTASISNALYFRRIDDREFSISEAHEETFRWIFDDRASVTKRWDSFSSWLRMGRGCYWINGKAGSGKSTLMKYLCTRDETSNLLKQWAGSASLVVASFFFWYAGTSLQRSQEGLLRSLLLAVLDQNPGLAPLLFPGVFRTSFAETAEGTKMSIELSYDELKKAFTTLLSSPPSGLKVCFIVDGLDEYEGDPNELSDLFTKPAFSESIKILLSSRPIPACVEAFSSCPKLRLQDMTRDDIALYARDKLGMHPLMKKLTVIELGASERIVDEITTKAAGVFLWVVLVAKSLLHGLQAYDTLSDLLERLNELPPDLERLYFHMLGSMSPQYRRQGSKVLQLVMRSMETHGQYPVTPLQLSFAEDKDYTKSIKAKSKALTPEREQWQCESIEGRMRSRCCGLIEVQDSPHAKVHAHKTVGVLHRTVIEFLRIGSIWDHLTILTRDTNFNVDQALLSSSLLEMKAKPPVTSL